LKLSYNKLIVVQKKWICWLSLASVPS